MVVIGKPTALPPTTTVQVIHIVNLMDAIDWENVDAVRRFFNAVSRNFPPDWTGCEVIENDLRIAEHKHSMLTPDELTRGVALEVIPEQYYHWHDRIGMVDVQFHYFASFDYRRGQGGRVNELTNPFVREFLKQLFEKEKQATG